MGYSVQYNRTRLAGYPSRPARSPCSLLTGRLGRGLARASGRPARSAGQRRRLTGVCVEGHTPKEVVNSPLGSARSLGQRRDENGPHRKMGGHTSNVALERVGECDEVLRGWGSFKPDLYLGRSPQREPPRSCNQPGARDSLMAARRGAIHCLYRSRNEQKERRLFWSLPFLAFWLFLLVPRNAQVPHSILTKS